MPIPINHYTDAEILDEELEKIFLRQMFVAHQSDIANPDDYLSFTLGKHAFTLRNFGEKNNLLDNVCRHRFNLVDPPGSGNRRFRCSYHGWTYGQDGAATFIPLRETFEKLPNDIRLPTIPHEDIHGFQFLMQAAAGRRNTIAGMFDKVGLPAAGHFFSAKIHHKCNWKLIVENVLEAYHLSFVHVASFSKAGFTSTSGSSAEEIDSDLDSLSSYHVDDVGAKQLRRIAPHIKPSYRHMFLFPNMFLSVGNELVYYVANVLPIAVDETMLSYRLFPTEKLLAMTPALRDHFMQHSIDLTARTLEEDRMMMEMNQIGLLSRNPGDAYILGETELRIKQFHKAYRRFI